jgi:long-chain fatty acid transport protein
MRRSKKFMALVLSLGLSAMALGNGLSLNSIGVKSMAMGGAYVGYANDATALYWNPAGLAGQGTSLVLWGSDIIPLGSYKNSMAGIDVEMEKNHYVSPNAIFNYQINDKMAFAFGVYVPAGLGSEWDGNKLKALTGGYGPYTWMSKIGVINFSPAFAYQITDQFSVGLAVNIYYGMFDMERAAAHPVSGLYSQYKESSTGLGYGATIGLKYDINEAFSLGATFRTSTTVTMSGTSDWTNEMLGTAPESWDFDRDVTWPMWIAGGMAWHVNEAMTITADAQYSAWSELDKLETKYDGGTTSDFVMKWEDAIQYRLGLEYYTSKALALRMGYYYDPAPAPDETVNFLFPSSTNNAFTGGLSYIGGSWSLDFGIEYLLGAEREITTQTEDNMAGTHKLDVFAFALGFNWAF